MRHWQTCWQTPPVCRWFRQTLFALTGNTDFERLLPVCRCLRAYAESWWQGVRTASAAVLPPLGGTAGGRWQMADGSEHPGGTDG